MAAYIKSIKLLPGLGIDNTTEDMCLVNSMK